MRTIRDAPAARPAKPLTVTSRSARTLAARLGRIADKAKAIAGPGARAMTKDEIDALSGQ